MKAEYQEKFWKYIEADQAEKKANPDKVINDLGSVKCRQLIREGKNKPNRRRKRKFQGKDFNGLCFRNISGTSKSEG